MGRAIQEQKRGRETGVQRLTLANGIWEELIKATLIERKGGRLSMHSTSIPEKRALSDSAKAGLDMNRPATEQEEHNVSLSKETQHLL